MDIVGGLRGDYGTAGVVGAIGEAYELGRAAYDTYTSARDAYAEASNFEQMAVEAAGGPAAINSTLARAVQATQVAKMKAAVGNRTVAVPGLTSRYVSSLHPGANPFKSGTSCPHTPPYVKEQNTLGQTPAPHLCDLRDWGYPAQDIERTTQQAKFTHAML